MLTQERAKPKLLPPFWGDTTIRERFMWPVVILGTSLVAGTVVALVPAIQPFGQVNNLMTPSASPPLLKAIGLITIIPLIETYLIQGLLQTFIERWKGPLTAFVLTSLVFFSLHYPLSIQILILTTLLCYIRMRTKSLGTVLLTHMALNTMAVTLGYILVHYNLS